MKNNNLLASLLSVVCLSPQYVNSILSNGADRLPEYRSVDVSASGNVLYSLHLEDTISAASVLAAVWLFTSGLIGLFSATRLKRS